MATTTPAQNITWHPLVAHDPAAEQSSNSRAAFGWRFLTLISFVAFAALAVFVTISSAPEMMLLTCAVMLAFGLPVVGYTKVFWDKADERTHAADLNKKIVTKLNALPSDAPALRKIIENLGVKTDKLSDQEVQKVRPVVAQAQALIAISDEALKEAAAEWNEEVATLEVNDKAVKVEIEKAQKFNAIDPTKPETLEIYKKLANRDVRILNDIQNALALRVQAAFCLRVIKHPHELVAPENFCRLYKIDDEWRIRAKTYEDADWDIFLKTDKVTLTRVQCEDFSAAKIAEQVFGL